MPTDIVCRDNGPLRIEGDFVLKDQNGNVFDLAGRKAISLCRCGLSKDKPFCDGSHKGVFECVTVARVLAPQAPKPASPPSSPPPPATPS